MKTLHFYILLIIIIGYALVNYLFLTPRIAYVESSRLTIGFAEAAKVDRELQAADKEWRDKLKLLQDSLAVFIQTMAVEYDKSSAAKKRELQDLLSAKNQQINNFRDANVKKIQSMQAERMKSVFDKANIYIDEYGKKHRYSIIFGTVAGGSILFGNKNGCDITDKIIAGLNERYK
jgi:Skp family chaperone for outer membrane proteins